MEGVITSFSGTTLNVNVDSIGGSGTYANWTISVAGIQGSNGVTSITGTASQVVASPSTGAVTLSLPSSINVNTTGYAAGLAGGGANYVPYQTAVNTTGFVSPGVVGQVFTSTGSGSAPNWQNATSPPGSPGYYGAWHDTSTVTATSTTTAYVMAIGSIDLENGTSIVGGTKLTVANTAVYNLQFSSQLSNPNAQIADVSIWIRLNGVNVTDGAGTNGVPAKHGSNNGLQIISWNYVLNLTAGDYIELVWHSDTTGVQLITFPATTSPAVPESPSLIVTIQAVTQIGIGYQGLTSATSVLIATGSKVFTTNFTNSQTAFAIGTRVRVAYSSTPANFMEGVVTAFSGTTFTVLVDSIGGSGTFASWTISVAGIQGSNGVTSFSGNSTGLTPSTATTGAITLAGTLVASNGGTGVAGTLTGLLYGNGTSAHTVATTAQALTLIGTVPVVNGGTGLTSLTAGYIPYGNGTGALSSSSNLFFNATGLGIGTSSPSTKLHVAGVITAGATTGEGGEIDFQNAAGTSVAAFIDVDGSNNFRIYNSTASASIFYTNNAPRMTIDASGNVGIGTSSPVNGLTVVQSGVGAITALNVINGDVGFAAGTGTAINFGISSTSTTGSFGQIASLNQTAGNGSDSYMTFSTRLSDVLSVKVRIDAAGNVGIGITPSTKLTVAGAITITGAFALRGSYGGGAISSNFAAGDGALVSNTTGSNNTASGVNALYSNTTGYYNTASGYAALYKNTTGFENTASGVSALYNNTTGSYNTASGMNALSGNTTGIFNTASGRYALFSNTTGSGNAASGMNALYSNTTGSNNTASGESALFSNTTGSGNAASGEQALVSNTTGIYNTASGYAALYNNTTGSGNSAFNPLNSAGAYAPVFNPTTQNDRFCMGSTGVTNAYIQVAWTVVSDARDKTNFAPVPHGLDFVNQLQPTAYQFKEDRETDVATGIVRYGFKAQDVLALEGDSPVIIDNEDLDKLRFNESSLIPVLVNAIKELTARLQILEAK